MAREPDGWVMLPGVGAAAANDDADDMAALRAVIEAVQDRLEELEASGFAPRTIAWALAAVAAEELYETGGPAALTAWAEALSERAGEG